MKKILLPMLAVTALAAVMSSCHNDAGEHPTKKFIETGYFDSSVKPGDNFFLFVNGKWIKGAVIPSTESGIGSFLDVYDTTKNRIHQLLDSVAKGGFAKGSIAQKVGDLYASGMDSATIEKLGITPIKPDLAKIDSLKNAKDIMAFVAQEAKSESNYLIGFYIGADDKNSAVNIAAFGQTGLGLPDRDYYFRTDAATVKVQKAYQTYITKILTLAGDDSVTANKKMWLIYSLEKEMAGSHRTNVELRDPQSNYNKKAVADLDKAMPNIGWKSLFDNLGFKVDSTNIQQPAYYQKLNTLLVSTPIDTWKDYLRFHIISDASSALSNDFVMAAFNYGKELSGQKEIKPRWKRMSGMVDGTLGDGLGELYVKKYFTDDAKKRMLDLVNNLQKAFEQRIDKLTWMSDSTKKVAIDKLHAFIKKIGYTDKWRDYSNVTIDRNNYFANLVSCSENDYKYQLGKLGKKVDKTEWGMTPPTVNAYYNPTFNEIVFPAGILQFPFFDADADDAINYGGIGMVIGHEMTHGFDDQGSQYDKDGNLKNWWSKGDSMQFVARTKNIINQFNGYSVLDTMHINGALTTGENSADLGGINIAYDAFKMTKEGQDTTKIDGFTPDQRFFISFAQVWRSKETDERARSLINEDPHSPPIWRVNGPLSNFEPFYKAFNVQPGDKMYKPDSLRVKIW
jgi:putative endopeptidase